MAMTHVDPEYRRFRSFAVQRQQCTVKWHIAGHDYFWAVSEMLDSAEECIFILDWWLSPELYLRRPPAAHPEWRLDRLLQRKAKQGVKVFIVVYNEVPEVATMNSAHSQSALESLHPNIRVMRHPEHVGLDLSEVVLLWSHHEKVVVVDNIKACIGGLDLCFGRWDTQTHPLADVHPTEFSKSLFPGQDYNNARYSDFKHVNNYLTNEFSILGQPRMPWEDLHMTLVGPAVLDIAQHFIERWNFVKSTKYHLDFKYDHLAFPHDISEASTESIKDHPMLAAWHREGIQFIERWRGDYKVPESDFGHAPSGTCNVQVVRSSSKWSHGIETEHSIQNAYIEMIKESKHFIYIENQFFISNTGPYGPVKNRIAEALLERIIRAAREGTKFRVMVCIPEVPGFAGSVQSSSIANILAAQFRTINRGGHSICEGIAKAGFEPEDYIRFYHLRTYDRINGPASLITGMEKRSGVSFDEAEVALVRKWLGNPQMGTQAPQFITVKSSLPAQTTFGVTEKPSDRLHPNQRGNHMPEQTAVVEKKVPVPRTEEEADQIINSFENCAGRSDDSVSDTVGQHVQHDRTALEEEQWLGTEDEERDAYVSEEIYIHTKCMIVDDMRVIMGSANLNDRSMNGDRDSEIALVVEDTHLIPSRMDGNNYMAASFAATLRRKIFRKHLGLIEPQFCTSKNDPVTAFMRPSPTPNPDESRAEGHEIVIDPLSDRLFERWNKHAKTNTDIYTKLFRTVPSNNVPSWARMKTYLPTISPGHVAPSAPASVDDIKYELGRIKGHLVEAQLEFLRDEKELTSDSSFLWSGHDPAVGVYV